MSENTFHITSEDVRNAESKEAKFNDGKTPKDSDVSAMKVRHASARIMDVPPVSRLLQET